jgi:DNA-binding transcriptional LysR family regulator
MELFQLRYFVAIARHRNFTRAAGSLGLAQPALSQQMRLLEAELGTQLLNRGRRETTLTAAGQVLFERAQTLLSDTEAARQAVSDVTALRAGKLVIAAINSISGRWLPARIRRFRDRHPGIELSLRVGRSDEVAELVCSGVAELGFLQLPADREQFRVRKLFYEDFHVLMPESHPLSAQASVTLAEIRKEPFVLYQGRARSVVLEACAKAGFSPRVACESGELDTVRELVSAGLGIAVLPRLAIDMDRAGSRSVPLHRPCLRRQIGWITRRRGTLSAAAEEMLRSLM